MRQGNQIQYYPFSRRLESDALAAARPLAGLPRIRSLPWLLLLAYVSRGVLLDSLRRRPTTPSASSSSRTCEESARRLPRLDCPLSLRRKLARHGVARQGDGCIEPTRRSAPNTHEGKRPRSREAV